MKKYTLCILLLMLTFLANTALARNLKVTSISDRPLVRLYFADTSSADTGNNYLNQPMYKGSTISVTLSDNVPKWDVLVFYAENKSSYFGLEAFEFDDTVELQIARDHFVLINRLGRAMYIDAVHPQ